MSDDDNVIRPVFGTPVDDDKPNLGLRRRLQPKRGCTHPQVEIEESTHDVTCVACDAFVSPALVLLRIAKDESLLFAARGEARRRHEELGKLEKRLKNMRGAIAQAKRQLRDTISESDARIISQGLRALLNEDR